MFLVVSSAITNGGDFLYVDSGLKLIKQYLGANFEYINNCVSKIEKINFEKYEYVIHIGGPMYSDRLIEQDFFPIFERIAMLRKPFYLFGCGWYGNVATDEKVNSYRFSEKSKQVLDYIDKYGILGCRDYLTVEILRNNGYQNVVMTGCPVWYDNLGGEKRKKSGIKRIIISDMGVTKNAQFNEAKYEQVVKVIRFIKKKFENVEVRFTFNHGINTKYSADFNKSVERFLKEEHIQYYELAGSRDGFGIYDDCDLHIGYRVHSHIYCLTREIPSVLICEDARGIGMNKTLGLPVICSNISEEEDFINNPYLLKNLNYEIDRMLEICEYEMQRIREWFNYCAGGVMGLFFEKILQNEEKK